MRQLQLNSKTKHDILQNLLKRSPNHYTEYENRVASIISEVREKKDEALFQYTKQFDGASVSADNVKVTDEEIKKAYEQVDETLLSVIRKAKENIRIYHEKQKQYVIPAKAAGVEHIFMCTPPSYDGSVYASTLVAAKEAGVDEIYKAGGAQAIAAMAFGTESIPKADKIVGPGNIYVALAKKAVFGFVSIDSIAGPSEILVLADETANPRYAAADLLSQAEHDELASAILITTSNEFAAKVSEEIDRFTKTLSRREIILKSLENYGYILVADSMEEAIEAANDIASEHLEIMTKNPYEVMTKIKNAGAIFIGEYSSEPLGDYFAGPNHVLPTNGTAKFFSPLGVDDFIKKSSIISYSKEALKEVYPDIVQFAECEKLTAHANSIRVRFEKEQE